MKKKAATNKKTRIVKAKVATTYDVDIAQEFKDVKTTFASRLDKIELKLDDWKTIFDRQLTQLNDNMKSVMDKIAQHEFRFTEHDKRIRDLEDGSLKSETRKEVVKETVSHLASFGWLAAKALLVVGAVIGSVGGCSWILRIFGLC